MLYEFQSVRGKNFLVEGDNPQQAWRNLVNREKDNGTLWRCSDSYCNQYAVEHCGFTYLDSDNHYSPVYKEVLTK
jgi:hypothetical protein